MKIIELDAANWRNFDDLYRTLLVALGAPAWHGHNLNALHETMIFDHDINALKPPYMIRFKGVASLPEELRRELLQLQAVVAHDGDGDVKVETDLT